MALPEIFTTVVLAATPTQPGTVAQQGTLDGLKGTKNVISQTLSEEEMAEIRGARENVFTRCMTGCVETNDRLKAEGHLPTDFNRMKGMDACRDKCAAAGDLTVRAFGIGESLNKLDSGNITEIEGEGVCAARVAKAIEDAETTREIVDPKYSWTYTGVPNVGYETDGGFPFEIQDELWEKCLAAMQQPTAE